MWNFTGKLKFVIKSRNSRTKNHPFLKVKKNFFNVFSIFLDKPEVYCESSQRINFRFYWFFVEKSVYFF